MYKYYNNPTYNQFLNFLFKQLYSRHDTFYMLDRIKQTYFRTKKSVNDR